MNSIKNFTNLPEWIDVENLFKQKISELMDIREIDPKLSNEDLKIEIRARQLAIDKFIEFLNTNSFSKIKQEDIQVTFS